MKKILLLALIFLKLTQYSQVVIDIDPTFTTGVGADNEILKTLLLPDGKIIAYGSFNNYNNLPKKNFVRLNNNGTIDPTFDCGTSFNQLPQHKINCMTYQADGKLLIGGRFTDFNGVNCKNIIRLNNDGSVDLTFNSSVGFNEEVNVIKTQSNNKIIVGGYFTSFGNDSCRNLARLNSNGQYDNSFQNGTGFLNTGSYGTNIYDLIVTTTDSIFAGGFFYYYNGKISKNIIKLSPNGNLDTMYTNGNGFNGAVFRILLQEDKKLFCFGHFNSYKNTPILNGARIDKNGNLDSGFQFNPLLFNVNMNDVQVNNKNQYLYSANISPNYFINKLCRTDSLGVDDSLNFKTGIAFGTGTVNAISIQPDSKIIAAGNFLSYRGSTCNKITRLIETNILGINEISKNKFTLVKIYPTPFINKLNIDLATIETQDIQISIVNTLGQIVYTTKNSNPQQEIDLSFLTGGIYYLKIQDKSEQKIFKIMKR